MQQILSVQELFTGEHWISECVIVIENGKVVNSASHQHISADQIV